MSSNKPTPCPACAAEGKPQCGNDYCPWTPSKASSLEGLKEAQKSIEKAVNKEPSKELVDLVSTIKVERKS